MGETGQVESEVQCEALTPFGRGEGTEPETAATTAIVPVNKGVTIGALLVASPALESVVGSMAEALSDATQQITRQMVEGLTVEIQKQCGRLAMHPTVVEIAKSARISGGHILGEEAFRNRGFASAFSKSETALNMLRLSESVTMPRLTGGVAGPAPSESYSRLLGMREGSTFGFHDAIERMNRPFRDALELCMGAHRANGEGAHLRIFEEIRAERQQSQAAFDAMLADIRNQRQQQAEDMQKTFASIAQFRQQKSEETAAQFANMARWQRQSILASQRWEVYEPEELPDQPITLESVEMALKEGRLSPAELEALLQQYKSGRQEPLSADIMFVAEQYKKFGHCYNTQENFVMHLRDAKNFPISVPTFKRYIVKYEEVTGERIRPGRGRQKRKLPKRREM